MELKRNQEARCCPDCGAVLESVEDGSFRCPNENTVWMAYGPKLLLKPAVVTGKKLALDLPWEGRRAA